MKGGEREFKVYTGGMQRHEGGDEDLLEEFEISKMK